MFVHLGQFGEQMIETPLLGQRADLVVSAPEVADQNSLEQGSQDVFNHRRAAAFGDQIIADSWVAKHHNQWVMPLSREPVSSAFKTALVEMLWPMA